MSETKTYQGGCHCGKVRYEVESEIGQVVACNCSICGKTGSLLFFAPAEKFRLLSGQEALSDYQFNKHRIHHLFCTTCGIRSFARGAGPGGTEMIAVNARCLDDVDPAAFPVRNFDGKSL
jgi:hypothetical protein